MLDNLDDITGVTQSQDRSHGTGVKQPEMKAEESHGTGVNSQSSNKSGIMRPEIKIDSEA